jgi:tetratricopeptide (TPR) repeat protein
VERLATEDASRDPLLRTWLVFCRADAIMTRDRGLYVDVMDELVRCFEVIGDARSACLQRVNLADAHLHVGGYTAAEALSRQSLREAGAMGLAHVHAAARVNLGRALTAMGRVSEAIALIDEGAREAEHARDVRRLAGNLLYLCDARSRAGDLAGAERDALAALVIEGAPRLWRVQAQMRLAEVLLASGRPEHALAASSDGLRLVEEGVAMEEGEVRARLVHAEALAACGHHDEARRVLAAAHDRLLTAAASIAPAWRNGFLLGVAEHARTIELAMSWGL